MYQKAREIPAANILSLSLGGDRHITPEQYWSKAAPPIRKFLEGNLDIRCIVTTSGVPYTIQATDGKDEGASFDSELAAILREQPGDRKRRQPNPLYLLGLNSYGINNPRRVQMVFVARLDGPDLKTVTRMVEDAIAVENSGFVGPVFGDAQGIDGVTGYGYGDASIRSAVDGLSAAGFETKLDMKQESWKQPPGGVGDQAAGAVFYAGWYDLLTFQDIFGRRGLARGSIAWHLASQECQNIWDPNGGWCINLMRRGAAVTLGPVREPYITAFPHGDVFVEALLAGESVAESYWLALPEVSWAMVVLGDPLYRPFALRPRPALMARAYIAENSSHVLQKGETSPLLVVLECAGPAGSGTPAMTAVAEPETGLAAASGSVAIPALKAGESIVVRVPSVTAGADPTGMFRLRLSAQDEQKQPRKIVLEGRIGFSRLPGGLLPKSQLFVSSRGDELISGRPGASTLIQPGTLHSRNITPSNDRIIMGAEFSPDGARIALSLLDPVQKKSTIVIADNKLGAIQALPPGTQFLRWLTRDAVLLKSTDHLIRHALGVGEDHVFEDTAGWSGPAVSGNVIPGTDIQFLVSADGRVAVQNGSQPLQEVLQGTKATRFGAIANDLSLFGGVDGEKRLWTQRGLLAKPEVVASGVEGVLWGPISRKAVVLEANNQSRVYDGRDQSWIDLGNIAGAAWSPDEERLLFVAEGYLSLLDGRRVEKLCDLTRIGSLGKVVISAGNDKAFLLAGIGGGSDVWMFALPPAHPITQK